MRLASYKFRTKRTVTYTIGKTYQIIHIKKHQCNVLSGLSAKPVSAGDVSALVGLKYLPSLRQQIDTRKKVENLLRVVHHSTLPLSTPL